MYYDPLKQRECHSTGEFEFRLENLHLIREFHIFHHINILIEHLVKTLAQGNQRHDSIGEFDF